MINFWKSATLLLVKNLRSLSLRSRGICVLMMTCLCGHVMQPAVASSVINTTLFCGRDDVTFYGIYKCFLVHVLICYRVSLHLIADKPTPTFAILLVEIFS